MDIGLRVVRGPDWKWGNQDDGEGHVGTVVEIGKPGSTTSPDKTVVVQWDSGSRTNCRVGYQGAYDLRIYDNAAIGVKHPHVGCDACKTWDFPGMRWKCTKCHDFDLCGLCYMAEKHDLEHSFQRFDTASSKGVTVSRRRGSSKIQVMGNFAGALVVRGPDWDWGNQDGGEGKVGKVTDVRGWDSESWRSVAAVTWSSGSTNVYRVGHKGKVDLKYMQAAGGGYYYRDHLPVLDPVEIRLSSRDLKLLLAGANLENLDLLDPNLAALIQTLTQLQQTTPQANPNLNAAASRPLTVAQPASMSRQSSRGQQEQAVVGPWIEIVEQPRARGLRFRNECEGRSAWSIPGESSTTEKKTFPTIKIHGHQGQAVIVVSCVSKDEPYKPQPHNLVGKDCKKGVCTIRIRDSNTVTFPHLGIQCARKKDVKGNLKQRQDINVDPFQTGFRHKGMTMDLNVVRLCFQVFLPDDHGQITQVVPPVVSQPIHDKKALNDLVICRLNRKSGKPRGGDEVFLLCEKINRDNVRMRFYEEENGEIVWEGFGEFGPHDVHRQYALVFKTPSYRDVYLQKPKDVWMQLQRSSDLEGSDPIKFTYLPEDPDPDRILEKRKRKSAVLNFLNTDSSGGGVGISQEALKQRLKLKPKRTASRGKQDSSYLLKEEGKEDNLKVWADFEFEAVRTKGCGVSCP